MDWTIYSIGDSAFLAEVLNGVAMITGTGDFFAVAQIGLLLGAILVFIQCLFAGAKAIDWQKVLASWLVFQFLFGASATVIIEDAYRGEVRVVDNVPLGVAAGGSLISQVGYELTTLFETAFSTPAMTEHGFSSSLETIKAIRMASLNRTSLGAANNAGGGNFTASWANYVRECTSVKVSLDGTGEVLEDVLTNPKVMEALSFLDQNFTTQIQISPTPVTLPCDQAFSALQAYTDGVFLPAFKQLTLSRALDLPQDQSLVEAKIEQALWGLGLTIDQKDLILASVLEPIFNQGMRYRAEDDRDFTYAAAIADAMKQREASWHAEGSLFRSIVHPMLTFLEGFTYAVTPVMGFLVVLGAAGIKIAGKYVLTLLWIQLWMPVLAITNLYAHFILAGKLAALTASGPDLTSIVGLYEAGNEVQKWLATAELLASTTPALTLMLVYGSSITMTHLASRLQGADYFDEKRVAPDLVNSVPVMQQTAGLSMDPTRGVGVTNAAGMLRSFSFTGQRSATEESAWQTAQAHSVRFGQSLAESLSASMSQTTAGGVSSAFREGTGVENSEAYRMAWAKTTSIADRHGITDSDQLRAIMNGVVGAGLGVSGVRIGGELGAGKNWSTTMAAAIEDDIRRSVGNDTAWQASFRDTAMKEVANNSSSSIAAGLSSDRVDQLTREAQEALSYQQSYVERSAMNRSVETRQTWDGAQAATAVASNPAAMGMLEAAIDRHGLNGAVDRYMSPEIVGALGGDKDKAWAYSALVTLDGGNWHAPALDAFDRTTRHDAMDAVLSAPFGTGWTNPDGTAGIGNSAGNQHIGGDLAEYGSVSRAVSHGIGNDFERDAAAQLSSYQAAANASDASIHNIGVGYHADNKEAFAPYATPVQNNASSNAARVEAEVDRVSENIDELMNKLSPQSNSNPAQGPGSLTGGSR